MKPLLARIEEATADLDNVDWVRSRSGEGYGWINIQANPSSDIDAMTPDLFADLTTPDGLPVVATADATTISGIDIASAAARAPEVRFAKVDTEANPKTSVRHRIRSIPTLLLFKGGAVQAQQVGMTSKDNLRKLLDAKL